MIYYRCGSIGKLDAEFETEVEEGAEVGRVVGEVFWTEILVLGVEDYIVVLFFVVA